MIERTRIDSVAQGRGRVLPLRLYADKDLGRWIVLLDSKKQSKTGIGRAWTFPHRSRCPGWSPSDLPSITEASIIEQCPAVAMGQVSEGTNL